MKTFILVYSPEIDKRALRSLIDEHPNILNWSKVFQHSYFLVSDINAQQLTRIFTKEFKDQEFFITEINPSPQKTNGSMGDEDWAFVISPEEA